MKNKTFKKSLSVFLAVLMLMSCWVWVPGEHNHVSAVASNVRGVPAIRGSHYAGTTAAYGTPVFDGNLDRWFKFHNKGSDYVKISYPSEIHLDKSETLQSAGYFFNVDWHFGQSTDYRILIGANAFGHNSQWSEYAKSHTMTKIFSDYGFDASVPSGSAGKVYNTSTGGTDYDLRVVGFGHTSQGTDGFNYNGIRHEKYILFRSNNSSDPNKATVYLMGTPTTDSNYLGKRSEYNTSGGSYGSYGWQQNYKSGWKENNNSMFKQKSYNAANDGCSSYYESQYAEMQWFVTLYDKSALNTAVTTADARLAETNKWTWASLQNLKSVLNSYRGVLTTRATNQSAIDTAKNKINEAINDLEERKFELTYENLFSLSGFVGSSSVAMNGGTLTYNIAEGSITTTDSVGGNTYCYSSNGAAGMYFMPIEKSSSPRTFIFECDAEATGGTGYVIPFDTKATHDGYDSTLGDFRPKTGKDQKFEFTVPANCDAIHIRFGTADGDGAKVKFSNIEIYEKSRQSMVDFARSHGVPARVIYNFNEAIATGTVPSLSGSNFTFNGWKVYNVDNNNDGAYDSISDYTDGKYNMQGSFPIYGNTSHKVLFDNLIDFRNWNTATASNGTITAVTENGFTLTCNEGAGEGTSSSPYFTVEPGKDYTVDIGFTGDAWDVYIFFCDENGTWIDFVDGESNRFSSGTTWDSTFTAPNKPEVVKAQIRVDANGSNNTVRFENIRVYEAGTVEDGVSYKLSQNATFDAAYGSLPTPTRTGYTFAGWKDCDGNIVTASSIVDSACDETLYSTWTPNTHTVTFEKADGSTTSAQYDYGTLGSAVTKPANTASSYGYDATKHYVYSWPTINTVTADATYNEIKTPVSHSYTETVTKQPTCTTAGEKTFICSCGYSYTQEISANAHSYTVFVNTVAPTCAEQGYTTYKCASCDATEKRDYTPAQHTIVKVEKQDATCTVPGWEAYEYCSKCDYTTKVDIPVIAHTEATKEENRVEATCGADGSYVLVTYCSVCNEEIKRENKTISATGAHTWNDGEQTKAPTCITEGVMTYTCTVCGGTKTEAISATGVHKFDGTWEWFNNGTTHRTKCTADNNCTEYKVENHSFTGETKKLDGENYHQYKCEKCDAYGTSAGLNAKEECFGEGTAFAQIDGDASQHKETCKCGRVKNDSHAYGKWYKDPENKTDNQGKMSHICSECSYKETSDCTYTLTEDVASTCTIQGHKTYECKDCGNGYSERLPLASHTAGDAVEENRVESTCTVAGSYESVVKCSVCSTELSRNKVTLPLAAHTEGEVVVENNVNPDCVNGGSYDNVVYCTVCDVELSRDTVTVPATGHNFGNVTEANAATCLASGNEAYKQCTVCNLYFAENAEKNATDGKTDTTSFVITQLDHSYTGAIKSDGNGKDATHSFKCVNGCDNYGAATNHTWNEGKVTTSATCLTGGVKTYTCTAENCGATYTENIEANGHNFGDVTEANAATCLAAGNETYKQCTVCNLYFAENAEKNATDGKTDTTSFVITQLDHSYTGAIKSDGNGKDATHSFKCVNGCDNYGAATNHTWNDGEVTTSATCLTGGVKTYTCTAENCGATYTENIDANGHNFGNVTKANAATCLAAGNEAYKQCTVCNLYFAENAEKNATDGKTDTTSFVITQLDHSYTGAIKSDGNGKDATHSFKCVNGCDNYGAATNHTWNDGEVTTSATCLTGGVKTYTCTAENCGATYTENIEANGHNFGDVTEANAATCLAAGNEAYKQCTVCNLYFAENAEKNATDGKTDTTSFVITQLDHSYTGAIKSDGNGKDATHSFKCVNGCDNYGAATNHTWNEGEVTTSATCLTGGVKTYTCTAENCGATYTENIDANGHNFGDVTAYKAPTCTETGNEAYKSCTSCGKFFAEKAGADSADGKDKAEDFTLAIVDDAHDWNEGKITTEPTCTEKGIKTYTCKHNSAHTREEDVSALDHIDADGNGYCDRESCKELICNHEGQGTKLTDDRAATCTEDGYTGDTRCAKCNEITAYGSVIPKLGHKDEDKNHACDNGCDVYQGEHIDADKNHTCDYGCSEAIGTCADENTDHKCDYGCDKVYGTCEDKDLDHNCDYGCDKVYGEHVDADKNHTCDYGCSETIGTCEDKDLDHDCDYGCDKVYGEHVDVDKNHTCDYGCKESIGTCEDKDLDHKCDYGCGKSDFGTHEDKNTDHKCDYGCKESIGTCEDKDLDHDCDYGCGQNYGEHVDTDKDHACDYGCKESIGTCEDKDLDHDCDYGCNKVYGTCEDADLDHDCDYGCNKVYGTCEDKDLDHDCDYGCDKVYGTCEDKDLDHKCDYGCGADFGKHEDENKDHKCDYGCSETIGTCEDNDKDHDCDYGCNKVYGEHVDADKNHVCDYGCKVAIGTCEDTDLDHKCDYGCNKVYGTCEDKDLDHDCDYGCGQNYGEHVDADKNHTCDYGCKEVIGAHTDSDTDDNHVCDYGCGAVIEACVDADPVDGKCDVCGADICKHGEYTHNDRVEATCTSEGNVEYWHCNTCGRNYSDENFEDILTNVEIPVDPNAHKLTHYEAKPSTCIEDGWVEYWSCSECGKNFADSEGKEVLEFIIDEKDGHDWIETAYSFATDGKSCTATRSCKRTGCDVAETAEATVKSEVTTDPTCTENGTTTYTAEFAVDWAETQTTTRVDVAALNHDWTETAYSFATDGKSCTATRSCKRTGCDVAETAEATVKSEITTDATCIEMGTTTYTAEFAVDWAETQTTTRVDVAKDSSNHTGEANVTKNYKPATCKEEGYTGDTYWSCCDALESKGQTIEALPHTEATRKENVVYPSCGNAGSYDVVTYCSVCSEDISRVTMTDPATGEHNFATVKEKVDATCNTEGYIIRVCGCGAEEKEIIPANDSVHVWETDENGAEKWIISKEPTCVSKGEKICYCTVSEGHYKVEYIEPTGHNYEAAENGVVAPSCMNQGYTKYICSKENCGSVEHRDFVAALGHDLVSVVTAPTCEERGYTENYCNRCTYTYTDSYTEATGHADKNGDGKCDGCKENNVSVCSCACHSTNWFIKLIYKIVRFIWKLLKVNADCRCGAIHY